MDYNIVGGDSHGDAHSSQLIPVVFAGRWDICCLKEDSAIFESIYFPSPERVLCSM